MAFSLCGYRSKAECPIPKSWSGSSGMRSTIPKRFVRSGEFDLVFCFEPLAALLVGKAAESARFSARTVMIGADGHLHGQLNMQNTDGEIFLGDPTTAAEREAIYETICGMRQEAGASTGKSAAPTIQSSLRHHILKMPEAVYEASGIIVNGRRLKSFVFSTDEDDSSLGSGAGAELLDSSPQATNKTAESNNAAKYFTENLLEPQSFLPNLNYKKRNHVSDSQSA